MSKESSRNAIAGKWRALIQGLPEIPPIYELSRKPLEAALWCLYMSKHKFSKDYLTYDEIGNVLREYLDLPITVIQLKRALAKAGGKNGKVIHQSNGDGIKISSSPGETYLKGLKREEPIHIVYISPNKPRSANKTLRDLVKSIPKNILYICDPYYGLNSIEVLETFARYHKKIFFLTSERGSGEKRTTIDNAIKNSKREYAKKIEYKYISKGEIHDRYILANDRFFIIGHGLKDLGNKESLIVQVEDRFGKDIRKNLEKAFLTRWDKAVVL